MVFNFIWFGSKNSNGLNSNKTFKLIILSSLEFLLKFNIDELWYFNIKTNLINLSIKYHFLILGLVNWYPHHQLLFLHVCLRYLQNQYIFNINLNFYLLNFLLHLINIYSVFFDFITQRILISKNFILNSFYLNLY